MAVNALGWIGAAALLINAVWVAIGLFALTTRKPRGESRPVGAA